jgi:hypothetical protein
MRHLSGKGAPKLTDDDALKVAREACTELGLPWDEPVVVKLTPRGYRVWTAADRIGGNLILYVDPDSAKVSHPASVPR